MSSSSTSSQTTESVEAKQSRSDGADPATKKKSSFVSFANPVAGFRVQFHVPDPASIAEYPTDGLCRCKIMCAGPQSVMVQMFIGNYIGDTDCKFRVSVRALKATPVMPSDSLVDIHGMWRANAQTVELSEVPSLKLPAGMAKAAFPSTMSKGLVYGRVFPGKESQLFLSFLLSREQGA
jgi:hypothetical protein